MARILIVDDDPDVVEAIEQLMIEEGHEVGSAASAKEGKQAVKDFEPHVMILDCRMESADSGIVMAQELRQEGCDIPILMLTSIGRVMGVEFEIDKEILPVEEFVDKPIKPELLIEKVNELLK